MWKPWRRASRSPYECLGVVARGGMGYVELVVKREGRFQRRYARKRLHSWFREDAQFRAMFMDEARLAGLVHHPNVVSVVDVGEDDDGPYLLMDFVDGVSLAALMAHAGAHHERLPIQIAVRITLETARGLHAAHELRGADGQPVGLVHRDVSPQNVLIGFDGSVRVTDFGIAKALGNLSKTTTGLLKGTIGYLAPEQLRFEEPDRRSDLFSLGVILYEALSGERLYPHHGGYESVRRTLSEPPPDIGYVRDDVPTPFVELLFELLAKDPERRLPTAQALVERLEAVLARLIDEEGSLEIAPYVETHAPLEPRTQAGRMAPIVSPAAAWRVPGAALAGVAGLVLLAATVPFILRHGTVAARAIPTVGGWHSCAVVDTRLYCWGKNSDGQLGLADQEDRSTPQEVPGLGRVTSVGLGYSHTCACNAVGQAFCWGRNGEGQLGFDSTTPTSRPRPVAEITDCDRIAVGLIHTCVLHRSGRVSCWGRNSHGQTGQPVVTRSGVVEQLPWDEIGNVPATEPVRRPALVPGLDGIRQVAAERDYTCAVRADGAIFCFGANGLGQLGGGTRSFREGPTRVRGIEDGVAVAGGRVSACALTRAGKVLCWGYNDFGALGDGTRTMRLEPREVVGLSAAEQIACGGRHCCAVRVGGGLSCWGRNHIGQVGSRAGVVVLTPAAIEGVSDVLHVSAAEGHTCAGTRRGLFCWGGGEGGQLGNGAFDAPHWTPTPVQGFGR